MRSIVMATLLLCVLAPPAKAQAASPPAGSPPAARRAQAKKKAPTTGPCIETTRCKANNPSACTFDDRDDVIAYACASWRKHISCVNAIEKPPVALADDQIWLIRQYYLDRNANAGCYRRNPLLDGAFKTSIWQTSDHSGYYGLEHAIQVVPTVTLGIPFGITGDGNAEKAIHNGGTVTGIGVRYTPVSYVVGLDLFFGIMEADKTALDPVKFPSPRFVVMGGGFDVGAGIFGVSVVHARLRGDGLFGENRDHTWFMQVTIDLAAVTTMLAGAASSTKEQ
jgi:hypothetical protein